MPQGVSADLIAAVEGFTRHDIDAYAVESQRRAAAAVSQERFARTLIAVTDASGNTVLDHDEHPRAGTTLEGLAKLRPAFAALGATRADGEARTYDEICLDRYPDVAHLEHVHHAGNSSGVVDGAAAAVVASEHWVRAHGVAPRARIRATAALGLRADHHAHRTRPRRRSAAWPKPGWPSATSICGRSTRPSPQSR